MMVSNYHQIENIQKYFIVSYIRMIETVKIEFLFFSFRSYSLRMFISLRKSNDPNDNKYFLFFLFFLSFLLMIQGKEKRNKTEMEGRTIMIQNISFSLDCTFFAFRMLEGDIFGFDGKYFTLG